MGGNGLNRRLHLAVVTVWILLIAATGFASGVRGLPAWYQVGLARAVTLSPHHSSTRLQQALVAATAAVSVVLLWLTNLTDPGVIAPSNEKDPGPRVGQGANTRVTE